MLPFQAEYKNGTQQSGSPSRVDEADLEKILYVRGIKK